VGPSRNTFIDAQGPSTPTLLQSPIASASSLFDPLTPTEDPYSDPGVYRPEQGRFPLSSHRPRVPQGLVNAIAEDPINAAALLLQIAESASLPATTQSKSQLLPLPVSRSLSIEPRSPVPALSSRLFPTSTATTTPMTSRASSAVTRHDSTVSAIAPTTQIFSLLDQVDKAKPPPVTKRQTSKNFYPACQGSATAAPGRTEKGEGGALGSNN